MTNFFEQELRTLITDAGFDVGKATFVGRVAYLPLDRERRARVEFVTCGTSDFYEAVRVTILNKDRGQVDCLLLRFRDYLLKDNSAQYSHIWVDYGKPGWYTKPTSAKWKGLTKVVHDYISVFA